MSHQCSLFFAMNSLSDISANSLSLDSVVELWVLEGRHYLGFSYLNFYTVTYASVGLCFSFTSFHM
jgi:hypothetical protein